MARAALLAAVMTLSLPLPEGCANALGKRQTAPPTPLAEPRREPVATTTVTATAPPVWAPPDTGGPPPAASAARSGNQDLERARVLVSAGEQKKVRALLEKKVREGKASQEEVAILLVACSILRDRACLAMVQSKVPEGEEP